MLAKNTPYWIKTSSSFLWNFFKKKSIIIGMLFILSVAALNNYNLGKTEALVYKNLRNAKIAKLVLKMSKKYDVNPLLITSIILSESGGYVYAVSHMNAKGLMQLMPATALYVAKATKHPAYQALKRNPNLIFKPEINIELAVRHLKGMHRYMRSKKWNIALHVYNLGSGAYKRGKRNYPYVNGILKRMRKWQG